MRVGLLLAAGLSERYGARNKLLASYRNRPLITYAANTLRKMTLDHLIAITPNESIEFHLDDFDIVRNARPEDGQGSSLALGAERALELGTERLLVVLADMPFVTTEHCETVLSRCQDHSPSASALNGQTMPPACFPRSAMTRLAQSRGPHGARDLLRNLPDSALVHADAKVLADFDTSEDFSRF